MTGWDAAADLVVVGSGVAGLTAAIAAQSLGVRVLVVTKAGIGDGSTSWAQGGVAVVLPDDLGERTPEDSVALHVADTMAAAAGLASRAATSAILTDGPAAVRRLLSAGARFDLAADGTWARTREGGHNAFRVVHAGGDATGAEVERALVAAAGKASVPVLERHNVTAVVRDSFGRVAGLSVTDGAGVSGFVSARAVLLATGGLGQLFQVTSNPVQATGDGVALGLRAGARVADLEFVQFHPTALFTGAVGQAPLITEAMRGEGARLVDETGAFVMDGVHPLGDLAPRDVVSGQIVRRMAELKSDHVLLDATHLDRPHFAQRFPTVYASCQAAGIDPVEQPIPVAPAAHFSCGGIVTTVDGRTDVTGLYAAGEVARTGLHGANRLASNSLLEGLVVGERVARAVHADLPSLPRRQPVFVDRSFSSVDKEKLRTTMSRHVGIGRDEAGLSSALTTLSESTVDMALAASAVVTAALTRAESRGCHLRTDFPRTSESWRHSVEFRLDETGLVVPAPARVLEGVG
ncbi:L-aspartate oxidase [Fodinicola acaciae]|uniref:L-aspartate oxidase n=1 Tax=Fodinicola acaciae TaxID=2681555 RepID=UPI0013D561C5|nr:L-aspartate oxidase [Fodinicola acaciae]